MKKFICAILAMVFLLSCLVGCANVSQIAGNVADAAAKELENQLKTTLEKHKVEVVELKTAFGKLNGEDDKAMQFFAAALIRCESDTAAQTCATALDALFEQAGAMVQTESAIAHEALVHKTLAYDHADFSAGNYYTVYVYNSTLLGNLKQEKS